MDIEASINKEIDLQNVLEANLISNDARVEELNELLESKQDEYESKRKRVAMLKIDASDDQAHLKNSQAELEKRKAILDNLRTLGEGSTDPAMLKELEEAQQSYNDKESQIKELKETYASMEEKIKEGNAEVDEISDQLNDLEEELTKLEGARGATVQQINDVKTRIAGLESQKA